MNFSFGILNVMWLNVMREGCLELVVGDNVWLVYVVRIDGVIVEVDCVIIFKLVFDVRKCYFVIIWFNEYCFIKDLVVDVFIFCCYNVVFDYLVGVFKYVMLVFICGINCNVCICFYVEVVFVF